MELLDMFFDTKKVHIEYSFEKFGLQHSPVPPRFEGMNFGKTHIQPEVESWIKQGLSCILSGGKPTELTAIAWAAILHFQAKGYSCRYINMRCYAEDVRRSLSNRGYVEYHEDLCGVQYLVIDEIDKSCGSQDEIIALYRLINHRYNDMKPTVLISNAGKEELVDVIGSSSVDRISEDGKVFFLDGKSWR